LVQVFAADNPVSVAFAKSTLESAGIGFVTKGDIARDLIGLGRFPSGMNLAVGSVQFLVDEHNAEEARQLLEDLREHDEGDETE
jgi:hypothetical protein